MVYNTTFMNNVTNIADIFLGVSQATGNQYLMGNLIMLSFAIVFLLFGTREDWFKVLIADSVLCSILAILLFSINMVAAYMIVVPFAAFLILIVIYLMS